MGRLRVLRQMVFSALSIEYISSSEVTIRPKAPTAVMRLELATNCSIYPWITSPVAGMKLAKIKWRICTLTSENMGNAANSANTTAISGTRDSNDT